MGYRACNSLYVAPAPLSAGGSSKMASKVRNRMRNVRHGNVLIRDDAEVLTRLRVEVTRSRRLRKNASPPSIPPDPGESLGHAVAEKLCGELCHDIENKVHIEGAKSDV